MKTFKTVLIITGILVAGMAFNTMAQTADNLPETKKELRKHEIKREAKVHKHAVKHQPKVYKHELKHELKQHKHHSLKSAKEHKRSKSDFKRHKKIEG